MEKPDLGDDLDRPLGQHARRRSERDIPYRRFALLGGLAVAVGLGVFVYVTGDPAGGRPFAVAAIEAPKAPLAVAPASDAAASDDTTGSPGRRRLARAGSSVEEASGVKVVRPNGASAPGALIIEVPKSLDIQLAPAPDPRLVQRYEHGILPKIGADGARPADVYARSFVLPKGLPANAPRIAIVVGGMGLSRDATLQALVRLPGAVTLAFAPYGKDLVAQAADAREQGHEIMLQAPMEPFDYATNNPGPRTLLTASDPAQNVERLRWLMSRFPGYVGVMNFLGGKFTADAAAFTPVLREIANRGLVYADDGTSTRSLAPTLAAGIGLPEVGTDVVLDAEPQASAIDAALARLETAARTKGLAVGSATGLPLTVERIERWSRGLSRRGVVLVPLSAAALRMPRVSSNPDR